MDLLHKTDYIYNMHIICICLSFAPWFSSPAGTFWDIWGRIWGPHFRCRGHTGHSPAPLHHTRQRFYCFYHQSRRASLCWQKNTNIWKNWGETWQTNLEQLEKELNLGTVKVMTPTSRPLPRAQALASEIKKDPRRETNFQLGDLWLAPTLRSPIWSKN